MLYRLWLPESGALEPVSYRLALGQLRDGDVETVDHVLPGLIGRHQVAERLELIVHVVDVLGLSTCDVLGLGPGDGLATEVPRA